MAARPPRALSRSSKGRLLPTANIASTVWSKSTRFPIPARAISALTSATAAPAAFRFWQGTSTSPATGSQTSPIRLVSAFAAAFRHCAGVPPASSQVAAAAMAHAAPTSAWQPPSAPDTVAFLVMRYPTAAAQESPRARSSSVNPRSSPSAMSTPGTTPALPAVGAATMRPIEAFVSSTAIA